VGALGKLMEQYPTALVLLGTERLPASKQKMKAAIKEVWRQYPKLRPYLDGDYIYLSQFQDGIGDAILDFRKMPAAGTIRGALLVEMTTAPNSLFSQWHAWNKVSMAELEILMQEWEEFKRSQVGGQSA